MTEPRDQDLARESGQAAHGIAIQSFYPDHKSQLARLARIEEKLSAE